MRVIVTRPARQAASWVLRLHEAGLDAVALPLIDIVGADDPSAVTAAWQTLSRHRLVVFVSPNAAQAFFDLAPAHVPWPHALPAASPGPGTTALLQDLGLPGDRIIEPAADAAQFDSETLWQQLRRHDWRGASVLVVRGAGGRDWLTQQLREAGAQVEHLAAYRRAVPVLDAPQRRTLETAMAAPARHLWLFSSSEAVDTLQGMAAGLPDTQPVAHADAVAPAAADGIARRGLAPWSTARALATHPRIAARAQQCGFGSVHECRPTLAAVVACIQSLRP